MTDEQLLKILCDGEKFTDAEYRGKKVELNKPFRTPDEKKKFGVYTENGNGDIVVVRFGDPNMEIRRDNKKARDNYRSRHKCDMQKDKSTPAYWSCKMWSGESVTSITDMAFKDAASYDGETKTITSVRDGVQEYLGVELGIEPADKIFTIFRSSSEISKLASRLEGLPIINEHCDVDKRVTKSMEIGKVGETEVLEYADDSTSSSLVLRNKANVSDKMLRLADSGKRQFSLGYKAKTRAHDEYDFEQYDIDPRHLALVDNARGGSTLTFQDGATMLKNFTDSDGKFKIDTFLSFMDEATEKMSDEDKEKLSGKMSDALGKEYEDAKAKLADMKAKMKDAEKDSDEYKDMSKKMADMETKIKDMEFQFGKKKEDEDKKEGDKEKKFGDADFKDAVSKAVDSGIKEHARVAEKAKAFLPESYSFADKSATEIMKEALAAEYPDEKFEDNEISTAFKTMKKSNQYQNFGDSGQQLQNAWYAPVGGKE